MFDGYGLDFVSCLKGLRQGEQPLSLIFSIYQINLYVCLQVSGSNGINVHVNDEKSYLNTMVELLNACAYWKVIVNLDNGRVVRCCMMNTLQFLLVFVLFHNNEIDLKDNYTYVRIYFTRQSIQEQTQSSGQESHVLEWRKLTDGVGNTELNIITYRRTFAQTCYVYLNPTRHGW